MSSPNKNIYMSSPHCSKQQYPSQSEDYLSLNVSKTWQQNKQQNNLRTVGHHFNANDRSNYSKAQKGFGSYYHRERGVYDNTMRTNNDSYYHISMLEDPWKHLFDRMHAMENAATSVNTSESNENVPLAEINE